VFGLKFKNPVGLATFDKDAKLYKELSNLVLVYRDRTLTPTGRKSKKTFVSKEDSAIINRMGFNNGGVLKL
jgi:dihydroorotate dehydrogenase